MLHDELESPFSLFARQNCISCPTPEPCSCPANYVCERTIQTCQQCATNFCVPTVGAPSGEGVSTGALAGAVVGCVVLLTFVVGGFFLWRKRVRAKKAAALALEKSSISPYDLQGPNVLGSPIPASPGVISPNSPVTPSAFSPLMSAGAGGDIRIYNNAVINLDPTSGRPLNPDNPFSDSASTSTSGTNVIPIAYLPPDSASMAISDGMNSPVPQRPARSPELNLRLPPQAVSRASLVDAATANAGNDLLAPRSPYAAQSTKSGLSVASSRASTISSASSVYDRPTIVTSAKVGRQVLGVVRAEVVPVPNSAPSTPGPSSPGRSPGATGLRPRASVRSPLAGPSFSSGDIEMGHSPSPPPLPGTRGSSSSSSTKSDPFSDLKTPTMDAYLRSPISPSSMPLPLSSPASPTSPASAQTGTTVRAANGRLLTPARDGFPPMPPIPPEAETPRSKQHFPRESTSSFVSATSRADSIINTGFVFYPPSPGGTTRTHPEDVHVRNGLAKDQPSRRTLGFSTGSNLSSVSSGLDAFPFHFAGSGGDGLVPAMPERMPQSMSMSTLAGAGVPGGVSEAAPRLTLAGLEGGTRASLDTLALSRDVEAYPLSFDKAGRR